jgi:hypothetical protein
MYARLPVAIHDLELFCVAQTDPAIQVIGSRATAMAVAGWMLSGNDFMTPGVARLSVVAAFLAEASVATVATDLMVGTAVMEGAPVMVMEAGAMEVGAMEVDMILATETMGGPNLGAPMLADSIQMEPMVSHRATVIAPIENSSGTLRNVMFTHIHTLKDVRQRVIIHRMVVIHQNVEGLEHILT